MSDISGKLVARFAALYAFLALVVIAAGLGAYAAYSMPSKASKRVVAFHAREIRVLREKQGDASLTRLADKFLGDQAAAHGYAIEKIVVTKVEQKGAEAKVHASVTLTDGLSSVTQQLVVVFRRNVWQAQVIESDQ